MLSMALGIFDCIFPKYICFNAYGVFFGYGWLWLWVLLVVACCSCGGRVVVASVLFCSCVILGCGWVCWHTKIFFNPCLEGQFFGVLALSVVIDIVGFLFRWLSWWMSGVYYSVSGLQWHLHLSPLFLGLLPLGYLSRTNINICWQIDASCSTSINLRGMSRESIMY